MPVEAPGYKGNLGTAAAPSTWSAGLWDGFFLDNIKNGTVDGRVFEFNFADGFKPSTNVNAAEAYWDRGLYVFGSDGFALSNLAGVGNAGGITGGSDGDNEGGFIRQTMGPWKLSRSSKDFAFEAICQTSTITDTKHNLFVGLMEDTAATATVPITAAGALADKNLVGFWRTEAVSGGAVVKFSYKADGIAAVDISAALGTISAVDTPFSVGMRFTVAPDFDTSSNYILRGYYNGIPVAGATKQIPSAAGTDFPNDIGMGFIWGVLNATAAAPGTSSIRRVRIAQLF